MSVSDTSGLLGGECCLLAHERAMHDGLDTSPFDASQFQ